MKKVLFAIVMLVIPAFVSAQSEYRNGKLVSKDGVRVPSGYQAHIEYSNLVFLKDGKTGMSVSTTHGFFYTNNMHIGLGIGLIVSPHDTYVPVFTSAKYVFQPIGKKVSPTAQLRLGSFFEEGAKPYADLAFGFRFASERDFAFSILLAGSYYAPFDVETWQYDSTLDRSFRGVEQRNLSCVSLRVGIEW